jgi:MFS family permease
MPTTCSSTGAVPRAGAESVREPKRTAWLSQRSSFGLQTAILATFFAASSAPTPLYGFYQQRFHFSAGVLTTIFAAYAVALLVALLTVGSLSDHLGRRPVLLTAIGAEVVAMAVFASAGGVASLLIARLIQGVATGAAMGVVGAGLLDLEPPATPGRGALANSVSPMIGLAAGGFACSALVEWVIAPTRLVYLILLGLLAVQALGVLVSPETSMFRPGTRTALRPRVGLPAAARPAVLIGAPAVIASWSVGGLYLSLGPTVARSMTGSGSELLGGWVVLLLAGSGSLAVLLLRGRRAESTMSFGAIALIVGMAITLLAVQRDSGTILFLSMPIAGAGFGAAFSGAMRLILPLAAPHERAELLASCYVISYLAFSVPAVAAGILVPHLGLLPTLRGYAVIVLVLAAGAGVGLRAQQRLTA